MRKRTVFWSFLVFVLAAASGIVFCQVADISGTWIGETEVPDQGTDELTLVLEKANGGYTGTLSDSLGMLTETDCEDIEYKDGILKFSFVIDDGYSTMTVSITLNVEGTAMTGYWETEDGDTGEVTMEKKTG